MPNGYINLIHYDDAARVVVAALLTTSTVVLVPAHCVTGIPTETIRVLVGQKNLKKMRSSMREGF